LEALFQDLEILLFTLLIQLLSLLRLEETFIGTMLIFISKLKLQLQLMTQEITMKWEETLDK